MFESFTGKLLVAAGMLPSLASPASGGSDTAALLAAQLDSVATFCTQRFPANKNQYTAFVEGILSGASPQEIERTRDTPDYERAREWDLSQLNANRNAAAAICSGLTTPTAR